MPAGPWIAISCLVSVTTVLAIVHRRWRQRHRRTAIYERLAAETGAEIVAKRPMKLRLRHGDHDLLLYDMYDLRLNNPARAIDGNILSMGRTLEEDDPAVPYEDAFRNQIRQPTITSVVTVSCQRRDIPDFMLKPETFASRLEAAYDGRNDINFRSDPVFSQANILTSDQPSQIMALFAHAELRRCFHHNRSLWLEWIAGDLNLYAYGQMLTAPETHALAAMATRIVDIIDRIPPLPAR